MDASALGWHQLYDWFGLNRLLFLKINALHSPTWDAFMHAVTEAADHRLFPWYLAAVFFLAHVAPRLIRFSSAVVFALSYLASWFIVGYIKTTLAMPRPVVVFGESAVHVVGAIRRELSFPSGHAVFAFVIAMSLTPGAPAAVKVLLWTFAVLAALSRIFVGAHFPADVVGGALIGIAIAGTIHLARRLVSGERS